MPNSRTPSRRRSGPAHCAYLPVIGTVLATEGGAAARIVAVLFCPLALILALLPLLGVMLNGTSSVLCGTVPEPAPLDGNERAPALFYTGIIASGASLRCSTAFSAIILAFTARHFCHGFDCGGHLSVGHYATFAS
jgi:hypothetical protein